MLPGSKLTPETGRSAVTVIKSWWWFHLYRVKVTWHVCGVCSSGLDLFIHSFNPLSIAKVFEAVFMKRHCISEGILLTTILTVPNTPSKGSRDSYSTSLCLLLKLTLLPNSVNCSWSCINSSLSRKSFPTTTAQSHASFHQKVFDLMIIVAKLIHLFISEILSTYCMQV